MKIKIGIVIDMFHIEQYGMDMGRGAEDEYKGVQRGYKGLYGVI